MTFELWSKASRSIIGAFPTESEALAAVREAVEKHGRAYAEEMAVIREDRRGRSKAVAEGADLVDRALSAKPRGERVSA